MVKNAVSYCHGLLTTVLKPMKIRGEKQIINVLCVHLTFCELHENTKCFISFPVYTGSSLVFFVQLTFDYFSNPRSFSSCDG